MKRLLLLLMLVSQPVWAGWVEVLRVDGGKEIFYMDPATLRKTADGRRIWEMTNYESSKTFGSQAFRSLRDLSEYDCAGERVRVLQQELFSGPMLTDLSVRRTSGDGAWQFIAPNTVGESLLKAVCRMPLK